MTVSRDLQANAELMLSDGVGMVARGDALVVLHAASAALERSRWLFSTFEALPGQSYVVLLVVGEHARPPSQAMRDQDTSGYSRIAPKLRRLVICADGTGFQTSLVRLVMNAYATLSGKRNLFAHARNLEEALSWLQEVRSPHTPASIQLAGDLERLRNELAKQPRSSRSP